MKWLRVTKSDRCPICNHPDWCTYCEIGVCCMRVQSSRPTKNGGWLHRTNKLVVRENHKVKDAPVYIDAEKLIEDWSKDTSTRQLKSFALSLGVSEESLAALNCCWSASHQAWAFPMRDGSSRIIGIRLRYLDGTKRSVKGSRNGLFIPMSPPNHPLFICEGPTDVAAALTIGCFAFGRPSCSEGLAHLYHAVKERRIMRAIIVSDNDADKKRPDGSSFNPGVDGANRLADELGIMTCLIIPPAKDMREFVRFGGTKQLLNSMIEQSVWHQPKKELKNTNSMEPFCTYEKTSCQGNYEF